MTEFHLKDPDSEYVEITSNAITRCRLLAMGYIDETPEDAEEAPAEPVFETKPSEPAEPPKTNQPLKPSPTTKFGSDDAPDSSKDQS